jgi:hypothetical protein
LIDEAPRAPRSGDFTFLIFPERATQLALKDLAGTGHRERIGSHIDAAGTLVAAYPLLTESDEVSCFELRARVYDHEGVHSFAPLRVRNADHGTLKDRRVLGDHIFYLDE